MVWDVLFRNGIQTEALSEKDISYDSNGNILALKRTGKDGSAVNDLVYSYDADGNMTFDGRTGMSLDWNDLGLVEKVSRSHSVRKKRHVRGSGRTLYKQVP